MVAAWADEPSARFSPSRLYKLMRRFADKMLSILLPIIKDVEKELAAVPSDNYKIHQKVSLDLREAENAVKGLDNHLSPEASKKRLILRLLA